MRFRVSIESQLQAQRGSLIHWVPVAFGMGIALYFSLRFEPDVRLLGCVSCGVLVLFLWLCYRGRLLAPYVGLVFAVSLGSTLGAIRGHVVAAPVLERAYFGTVEGRITRIDRSASDALRLTLENVHLPALRRGAMPERIRMSLHAQTEKIVPKPGQHIRAKGVLYPPSGPVEPYGFDFQRHAWFARLGGVGFSKSPLEEIAPPKPGLSLGAIRYALAREIRSLLPGDIGGVAAAITTGERVGLTKPILEALRKTNLAHLLAISGLHMGLLVGVVFGSIRFLLCLSPPLALRIPVKKIAASGAICAAAIYLFLSGVSVATERAFVMALVALVAILFDRRALSLRSVAIAALVVLILRPESLLSPGFQMSFAATLALVWVFSSWRDVSLFVTWPWVRKFGMLVLSSAVAGAATAPFAAAHFNLYALYSLPANLLSVPVMGAVVMPGAVLAACLAPFGGAWLGLAIMGAGLSWILKVATFFAALPDAGIPVLTPGPLVLPLLSFGALFCILWQGHLRFLGLPLVGVAFILWALQDRPSVLVAETGRLVGVMTDSGRALSKAKGEGFVAHVWLENDGDAAFQWQAALRLQEMENGVFTARLDRGQLWHVHGKTGLRNFKACNDTDIVVASVAMSEHNRCELFDKNRLSKTGAIAIWQRTSGVEIVTVAQTRGRRLWSPAAQR